ncbi:MAG TPA: FAD-binding protein, partial [Galbitalea sp.]
ELAEEINVPADVLENSVSDYNRMVDGNEPDPFGRTTLAHSRGDLVRIDAGPFYAYESTSGIVATYCGLAVTTNARVRDVFGNEIPGLSAAGEIMGGIHGAGYMTGTSLVKSVVFGRIAGRDVATR